MKIIGFLFVLLFFLASPVSASEPWRGLTVEPENRCSRYDRSDYYYPPSIEPKIVERIGGIISPYTGERFNSIKETDIEHIVATSEAHDSGLCKASPASRRAFATDLDNLTLASPKLNRHQKRAKDAAEWMPDQSRCWFVSTVLSVKRKYGLSVDEAERSALERAINQCKGSTPATATAPQQENRLLREELQRPTPTTAMASQQENRLLREELQRLRSCLQR